MERRKIKLLVLASYTQGVLDEEKVVRIANLLSRRDLKEYIRAIKHYEKHLYVTVEAPYEIDDRHKDTFAKLFPDKKIIFRIDPSLLLGVKITSNDTVYEMDVKSQLDSLLTTIEQDYDQ